MRVLHVLGGLHAAGIESLALQLIRHAPTGITSDLLNADRSAQAMALAFAQLQTDGRLEALHQWPPCDGPLVTWRSFRLCLRRRPDALLIYPCNRPMLWLALGARLAGVRRLAVAVQNTAPTDPRLLSTWHRLLCWFQRLGVVAVSCTQAIVESLLPLPTGLRLGPVIANGCDTKAVARRATSARAQRPPGDPRRVLMVARLDPIKDQSTLIRAFAAARQPGWQLQLVGDGPDRQRLETLATEFGLDVSEVFLGRRSDIPYLLGQADIFVFSTTPAEGFGIVLIEAMAAGLPILASDVPACREVLLDGAAGDLLPPGDDHAWTDRLHQLMTQPEARSALAQRSITHAARYDIVHCAERWYSMLIK